MPELPEVEIARRQVVRWLGRAPVIAVRVPTPSSVRARRSTAPRDAHPAGGDALGSLVGARLIGTARVGKRLWLDFGAAAVEVHLGMSGRLVRAAPDAPPTPHGRVAWVTQDAAVWLDDPRRFGCVVPSAQGADWTAGLGPDALDTAWDGPSLAARCASGAPIKTVLMDQARIAGLGNIQVAEILHAAGVAPAVPARALGASAWARVATAVGPVLRASIDATDVGGASVDYLSDGAHVVNPFRVYGRTTCGTCGGPTARARHGGRSTWWCPACQDDDGAALNGLSRGSA